MSTPIENTAFAADMRDESSGAGIGHRVESMGEGAQMVFDQARGLMDDVSQKLDLGGRMERNPYGTLLVAAGVGYLLGGGLFTPLTGNLVKLGLRLAALPIVKDELMGMSSHARGTDH